MNEEWEGLQAYQSFLKNYSTEGQTIWGLEIGSMQGKCLNHYTISPTISYYLT